MSVIMNIRRIGLLFAAIFLFAATDARAAQITISLNLLYSDPTDVSSGGIWQVAAKSSNHGIAALSAALTGIETSATRATGPSGLIDGTNAAGFTIFETATFAPGYVEVITGQSLITGNLDGQRTAFYGVGSLVNGAPRFLSMPPEWRSIGPTLANFTNPTNTPWARGDAFADPSWDTAVVLAEGTFAPGSTPTFFEGNFPSAGMVFTTLPNDNFEHGEMTLVDPAQTIVRTNLRSSN
jgi:hypothetical protein